MANGYYNHTTYPATNAAGSSASMRSELDAITSGFALLPVPLGSGQQGFSGGNWINPIIQGQSGLGSIDAIPIGGTTPAVGNFTTSTIASLTATTADINGGTVDATVIGATTPAAVTATTLKANAAVNFTTGGTLAGTFTGGTFSGALIQNTPIGSVTPSTGAFTTLGATGAVTFSGGGAITGTYTGAPTFSGNPSFTGAPTFSGNPSFTGAPTYSNRPSFGGNLAWDAGNLVGPLIAANNLSDVANVATARNNLGVGLVLLGSGTVSSNANGALITGLISSVYDDYRIVVDSVQGNTASDFLVVQVSVDNGSTYQSSNYYYALSSTSASSGVTTVGTSLVGAGIALGFGGSMPITGGFHISGTIDIYDVNSTSMTKDIRALVQGAFSSGNYQRIETCGSWQGASTAINALKIFASGVNPLSLRWKLYGYKK